MLTLNDLLEATSGKLLGTASKVRISGISTDTRTIKPGEAFLALCGEHFDGHKFFGLAVKKGAKILIVSKRVRPAPAIPVILVKNTTHALGDIARFHRRRFQIPVIAITGSAGKTTTKEMTAAVLSSQLSTLKNFKTENNHIGVPSTLLRLNQKHEAAVLELGTNHPGEIRYLAKIVEPTVAVFTNVGASHLEGLKTVSGVYKEKVQLANSLSKNGTIIYNADDAYLRRIRKAKFRQRKISVALRVPAEYRAVGIKAFEEGVLRFRVNRKDYQLNSAATHNIYNALSAICCGELLGIRYNNIYKSLKAFRGNDGRQSLLRLGKVTVINDTYNANPISVMGAIQTLESFPQKARKIFICADMLELGRQSKLWHERIGRALHLSKVQAVLTYGRFAKEMGNKARNRKQRIARHFEDIEGLCGYLDSFVLPGDIILVKGSRGMKMERVVEHLKEKLKA